MEEGTSEKEAVNMQIRIFTTPERKNRKWRLKESRR